MRNTTKTSIVFMLLLGLGLEIGILIPHLKVATLTLLLTPAAQSVPSPVPDDLLTFSICGSLAGGIAGLLLLAGSQRARLLSNSFFGPRSDTNRAVTFKKQLSLALFLGSFWPLVIWMAAVVMSFFPWILGSLISDLWGDLFINAFLVFFGVRVGFAATSFFKGEPISAVRWLSYLVLLGMIEVQILLVDALEYLPDGFFLGETPEAVGLCGEGIRGFFPFLCCGVAAGWVRVFLRRWKS